MIQNRLQMGELSSAHDPERAALRMREALQFAEKLGDSGQYFSRAVFEATSGYLEHGILYPKYYEAEDIGRIRKMLERSILAYESQKNQQPFLNYKIKKLELLWAAFSKKALKIKVSTPAPQDLPPELKALSLALGFNY
ncbi:hypothetical protein HZA26_00215 [Candidatus Nomurabacteria bacterium]|nr:hypothetical protein [Candidatus Nomurabacteria bacterium]